MHKSVSTDNFVVENVILSYPHLWQPQAAQGSSQPKYSAAGLMQPDNPMVAHIQAEAQRIAQQAFPGGEWQYPNFRWPLMPAGIKKQYKDNPRLASCQVFNAKASVDYPPQVVDQNRQPVMDRGMIYAGCIVAMYVRLYSYNNAGNVGIGVGLSIVMKQGDGEPLADSAVDAATAMASVAPIAGAPAPYSTPGAPGGAALPPQGYPQAPAAPQGYPQAPAAPQGYPQAPVAPQGYPAPQAPQAHPSPQAPQPTAPAAPPGWTPPQG